MSLIHGYFLNAIRAQQVERLEADIWVAQAYQCIGHNLVVQLERILRHSNVVPDRANSIWRRNGKDSFKLRHGLGESAIPMDPSMHMPSALQPLLMKVVGHGTHHFAKEDRFWAARNELRSKTVHAALKHW